MRVLIQRFLMLFAFTFIKDFLNPHTLQDIGNVICHPDGAKIIEMLQKSCCISDKELKYSKHTLINYGNMSSCSVIFALKEAFKERNTQNGYDVLMAFGPGFSAEGLLIKW